MGRTNAGFLTGFFGRLVTVLGAVVVRAFFFFLIARNDGPFLSICKMNKWKITKIRKTFDWLVSGKQPKIKRKQCLIVLDHYLLWVWFWVQVVLSLL